MRRVLLCSALALALMPAHVEARPISEELHIVFVGHLADGNHRFQTADGRQFVTLDCPRCTIAGDGYPGPGRVHRFGNTILDGDNDVFAIQQR